MAITTHMNPIQAQTVGWKKVKVTATGIVAKLKAGMIFGGIYMPTAGTTTTLTAYDAASADAAKLLYPATATLTAGQYVGPMGGVSPITVAAPWGDGLALETGLYLTVGGTGSPVFWVLYK